jgi:nucleoside-triphosphatase THEP1
VVDSVLDAVEDKALRDALAAHQKAIVDEINGIEVLCRAVDAAITRARGVGGARR